MIGASVLGTRVLASGLPRITASFSDDGLLRAGDYSLAIYDAFRARYGRDERFVVGIRPREVFDVEFLARLKALHEDIEASVPYLTEVKSLLTARSTRCVVDEIVVDDLRELWPREPRSPYAPSSVADALPPRGRDWGWRE